MDDHFREVTKMISLAKGAKREVKDYMLTRFACYLIAQNGDPKKDTTEDMKLRLGIKSTRPLADFLPTLTIAAKNLATEMQTTMWSRKTFMVNRALLPNTFRTM